MGACYQTLQTSNRNSQGTHSLELAETGLEDALWTLNKSDWTGWTINNASVPKVATKTLDGFSFGNGVTGSVSLTIENYDGAVSPGTRTLKITGITTLADGSQVVRKLQTTAQRGPLFVNAVAAIGTSTQSDGPAATGVSFTNAGTVESFNSDPNSGTSPNIFAAVISSGSRVTLTNARVKGYVAATNGSPTYSSQGRLSGPNSPASSLIDQTRVSTSPYQPIFDLKVPTGVMESTFPVGPASTTIGTPGVTTYYFPADVVLSGSTVLTIDGPVVIVVPGDFKIQDSAQIVVTNNGSLQVILSGLAGELLIGGNGIKNNTLRPKNVAIFSGTTSPTEAPTLSTTVDFYGVIYAPYANRDFTVSSDLNFYGSIVAKNVRISGSPNIRYDVDLRTTTTFSGIDTPFVVSAWQEVAP